MKAKLALLRECMERSTLMDDKTKNCINDCFAEVLQCRAYRNAIIHHHIYDHAQGIGTFVDDAKKELSDNGIAPRADHALPDHVLVVVE